MPSYDYEADLQALADAAQGTADLIQAFKDKDVEDFVPSEGDLGNDDVWDAVDEFKNRWEEGVNNFVKDLEEMSGRLGKITMNYAETDQTGYDGFAARKSAVSDVHIPGG
jgi:hypothetical protein